MRFWITEHELEPETAVIELAGEIDLRAAPELKSRLIKRMEQGTRRFLIDLCHATFIDSTAIGVLAGRVRELRERDGTLVLVCTEPNLLSTFEMAGVERVFGIYDSRDEALASLPGQAVAPA